MELIVEGPEDKELSDEELALIEKARVALKEQNFSVTERIGHRSYTQVMAAIVWVREEGVGIDFKAHVPNMIGQAFLGPEAPLTEELFVGSQFKPEFLKQVHQAFDDYLEHCKRFRTESETKK